MWRRSIRGRRWRLGSWRWALAASVGLIGCSNAEVAPDVEEVPIVLEERSEFAAHEGELVTIRGTLMAIKAPMILGVSVGRVERGMHGRLVEATGILEWRSVPLPENVWDSNAVRMGDFYVLRDPGKPNYLAEPYLVR